MECYNNNTSTHDTNKICKLNDGYLPSLLKTIFSDPKYSVLITRIPDLDKPNYDDLDYYYKSNFPNLYK